MDLDKDELEVTKELIKEQLDIKDKIRNIIEDLRSSEWYDDYETIQGTIEDIYLLVKE
jgi:hypothetical protein